MPSRDFTCTNPKCPCDQHGGIARHLEHGDFDRLVRYIPRDGKSPHATASGASRRAAKDRVVTAAIHRTQVSKQYAKLTDRPEE
jgi:hypothetical protein